MTRLKYAVSADTEALTPYSGEFEVDAYTEVIVSLLSIRATDHITLLFAGGMRITYSIVPDKIETAVSIG